MEIKVESLNVQELKIGMVILKDIIKSGNLLIKQGTVINEEILMVLKRAYFLEKIEVSVSQEVIAKSSKEAEMTRLQETLKEISAELEVLLKNLNDVNEESVNELIDFSNRIQKELKAIEIVISTVIFGKSEEYSIYRHSVNVAVLSALIGKWIGLEYSKINLLIFSALLHDFGITKIDEIISNKHDILLQEENVIIKRHAKLAYKYIENISCLDKSVGYGILMHHEREDGSGYPMGITGEKIHSFAKIIAIADELDMMNSCKGYKSERGPFEILEIIKDKGLTKLDYEYSHIFLEHIGNYYMGEDVLLSTNERAKILQINMNNLSKPLLLKEGEFIDLCQNKDIYIKEILVV